MRAALLSAALLASCTPTAVTVAADQPPRRQHAEPQPLPDLPPRTTTTRASRSRARTNVGGGARVRRSVTTTPAGPCAGWRTLVARHFPASAVEGACKRLMCESGGNPNARNRSGATGLFQIMHGPLEPEANAAAAAALYARRGWKPWVCS